MDQKAKPDRRSTVGAVGEHAVREHATRLSWQIIDHNVRWREGELDLIAVDGSTLVFAEVKTLVARGANGTTPFSPFESIDRRKQDQIRSLARRWISDELRRLAAPFDRQISSFRFDAFAVTLSRQHEVLAIEHLEDAF
ncbi:MAG: YraN family protein [Thermoleophilaceae bacterium]|nr:YraN family protein [Thermoleophilaceae bacterium]